MVSFFHDFPILHHKDMVEVANQIKTMRNDKQCLIFFQIVKYICNDF